MGRVDAFQPQGNNKKETVIPWTDVFEISNPSSLTTGSWILVSFTSIYLRSHFVFLNSMHFGSLNAAFTFYI